MVKGHAMLTIAISPPSAEPKEFPNKGQAGQGPTTEPVRQQMLGLALHLYSHCTTLGRPIPPWFRMKTDNKIHYNAHRRHWRRTKLGI